ncbi:MBL fold metallo-hydrolase [Flammeovirga pectinis]|uniref:MBL fold metallo-hydrolase n=1 Tax=Flammeovirga pectinis TaxID=2494373 RepID=A0A3Q9FPM6_9BACT|nr:MBL fold metallo-hydrolase [Flammeovirga pectinis]AZQ63071.1 MBL fold metallo-hydrolase [Flammeovirga pectinis]
MLHLFSHQFGGPFSDNEEKKLEKSKNWKDGKFENLELTTMNINLKTIPGLLKAQLTNRAARAPKKSLPIVPLDKNLFESSPDIPKCVWYGHSCALLQIEGTTILIDPMLGPDASPIGPVTTKRFSENSLDVIDQLPEIDVLMLTHDHYDHLDLASITKLKPKVRKYIVGLGSKRHLIKWGVNADLITEMDWWDKTLFEGIEITYTPSRHFSGRGLTDRAKSLWGGWAFITATTRIYWSGDGGYGDHFKEIGDKLGPFDWGFMENGQYNENWHSIHMYPEESVQAAIDAKVKNALPVHWGGFVLALHPWKEPIERFIIEAKKKNIKFFTPKIGEVVTLGEEDKHTNWWNELD